MSDNSVVGSWTYRSLLNDPIDRIPAIVGLAVRTIPHSSDTPPPTVHPAGVVALFYAVKTG